MIQSFVLDDNKMIQSFVLDDNKMITSFVLKTDEHALAVYELLFYGEERGILCENLHGNTESVCRS